MEETRERLDETRLSIVLSLARYAGLVDPELADVLMSVSAIVEVEPTDRVSRSINDCLLALRQLDAVLAGDEPVDFRRERRNAPRADPASEGAGRCAHREGNSDRAADGRGRRRRARRRECLMPAIRRTNGSIVASADTADGRLSTQIEIVHATGQSDSSSACGGLDQERRRITLSALNHVDVFFGPQTDFIRVPQGALGCAAPCWSYTVENDTAWTPTATIHITVDWRLEPGLRHHLLPQGRDAQRHQRRAILHGLDRGKRNPSPRHRCHLACSARRSWRAAASAPMTASASNVRDVEVTRRRAGPDAASRVTSADWTAPRTILTVRPAQRRPDTHRDWTAVDFILTYYSRTVDAD